MGGFDDIRLPEGVLPENALSEIQLSTYLNKKQIEQLYHDERNGFGSRVLAESIKQIVKDAAITDAPYDTAMCGARERYEQHASANAKELEAALQTLRLPNGERAITDAQINNLPRNDQGYIDDRTYRGPNSGIGSLLRNHVKLLLEGSIKETGMPRG